MLRILRHSASRLLFAIVLLAVPLLGQTGQAQTGQEVPAAPVPAQITNAKRVFISNAGEVSSYWLHRMNHYSGGPNRAYNQLYAAIKSWGQYDLVSAPADADLILELSFVSEAPHEGPLQDRSRFRLLVLDPKTRTTLWAFTSYVEPANLLKNRDRNYGLALTEIVDDLRNLVSPPAATQK